MFKQPVVGLQSFQDLDLLVLIMQLAHAIEQLAEELRRHLTSQAQQFGMLRAAGVVAFRRRRRSRCGSACDRQEPFKAVLHEPQGQGAIRL